MATHAKCQTWQHTRRAKHGNTHERRKDGNVREICPNKTCTCASGAFGKKQKLGNFKNVRVKRPPQCIRVDTVQHALHASSSYFRLSRLPRRIAKTSSSGHITF
ncbi:hypothetical protein POVWA2_034540 [Plasmodium ovale wallikeri]|uniref:Uncharacterized protein n=1 Tax=Plasmodium ovale wallikeri TaxID=864142 RepID=A0A1A8YY50_PLAOA|nr:hypothetical protein POVWA1_032230 [Plasmodium ovale wallikeri]SBT37822.1 hypothetical protein POVWA2_034540 [Plasmodium ovale wallikeri]